MIEVENQICQICGRPYGSCDEAEHDRHVKQISPAYGFGDATEETRFHALSVSPKVGPLRVNANGEKVADVKTVVYNPKE